MSTEVGAESGFGSDSESSNGHAVSSLVPSPVHSQSQIQSPPSKANDVFQMPQSKNSVAKGNFQVAVEADGCQAPTRYRSLQRQSNFDLDTTSGAQFYQHHSSTLTTQNVKKNVGRETISKDSRRAESKAKRSDSGIADVYHVNDSQQETRAKSKHLKMVAGSNSDRLITYQTNSKAYNSNGMEFENLNHSSVSGYYATERSYPYRPTNRHSKSVTDIYEASTSTLTNRSSSKDELRKRLFSEGADRSDRDVTSKNYSNSLPRYVTDKSSYNSNYDSRTTLSKPALTNNQDKRYESMGDSLSNDSSRFETLPKVKRSMDNCNGNYFPENRFFQTPVNQQRAVAGIYRKKEAHILPHSPDKNHHRKISIKSKALPPTGFSPSSTASAGRTLRSTSVQETSTVSNKTKALPPKSRSFASKFKVDGEVSFNSATQKLNIKEGLPSTEEEYKDAAMGMKLGRYLSDERSQPKKQQPMVTLEPGSRPVLIRPRSALSNFFRSASRSSQHSATTENAEENLNISPKNDLKCRRKNK